MKKQQYLNGLGVGCSGKPFSIIPNYQGMNYKNTTQNILKDYKKKKINKSNITSINNNFLTEVKKLKKKTTQRNDKEVKEIERAHV